MSEEVLIQFRRDISDQWLMRNPVLDNGEIALDTDQKQFKVGNGHTAWLDLPFFYFEETFVDLFLI